MKYYLEQPPLVLAVIHFRAEGISGLAESINTLRSALTEIGYPGFHEGQLEERTFQIGADDLNIKPTRSQRSRYTFSGPGSFDQLQIIDGHVILKTTSYPGFDNFYKKFEAVLTACESCIPSFKKSLTNRLSTRYANLIAPEHGEAKDYLRARETVDFQEKFKATSIYSSVRRILETATGRHLNLRMEELPTIERRIIKLLPDDLMEYDQESLMKIKGKPWWSNFESSSYYIVDVDHIQLFADKPTYQRENLLQNLVDLHDQASELFWLLISDHAEKAWGKKECPPPNEVIHKRY